MTPSIHSVVSPNPSLVPRLLMGREPGYEVSPMRLTQVACAESAVMTVCDLCDVIQIHWFVKAVDKWVPKHPQIFSISIRSIYSTQHPTAYNV